MPSGGAERDRGRGDRRFPDPPLAAGALTGRRVLITGASDGIGRALAWQCALAGADLELVGRNEAKTRHLAGELVSATGRRTIGVRIADLARLDDMHALADALLADGRPLHVVVGNAGALFMDRQLTGDGLERTFALCHLGVAVPVLRLLPLLTAAAGGGAPARVLVTASTAHWRARPDPDDWQLSRGYGAWRAYGNAKLANILFVRALARHLDATRIVAHAVHPGLVASRFARGDNGVRGRLVHRLIAAFGVPVEAGADTLAWLTACAAATHGSGGYWARRQPARLSPQARDDDGLGASLWRETLRLGALEERALGPYAPPPRTAAVHASPPAPLSEAGS